MLNLTYEYKLIPTDAQRETFDHWLVICRKVYNYALRERKDWVNSRKCDINSCSIKQEYIIPADAPRPTFARQCKSLAEAKKSIPELKLPHTHVLQQVLRQLEAAFVAMWERGHGFPRFKKLIDRPRFFVDGQRQLKSLQRQLKHKKKGSRKFRQLQHRIAKHHEYISTSRKDFHFKTAHHLCDAAQTVFAEDLNLKPMSSGMLCKHTLDAGFGQFLNILSHVCFKRGSYFAKVNPNGTSQTCPKCQTHTGKKELSQRVHKCPECGYETNRDVAAAQVVLQRGYTAVGHIAVNFGEGKLHE